MLLHYSSIPPKNYHCSLALHLLNTAIMCIPIQWKSADPPTIANWIRHINKIAEMEDLVHQAKDTPTKIGLAGITSKRQIFPITFLVISEDIRCQVGCRRKSPPFSPLIFTSSSPSSSSLSIYYLTALNITFLKRQIFHAYYL